jgi:hypothetical protein
MQLILVDGSFCPVGQEIDAGVYYFISPFPASFNLALSASRFF